MKRFTWAMLCVCVGLVAGVVGCLGGEIIISEVAWAGSAASSTDEWIELQNVGDTEVDLAGWTLAFGDVLIPLGEVNADTLDVRNTTLASGAFLILERTFDDTISDIEADIIYKGTLVNGGVVIELRDPSEAIVDTVLLVESGWPAGTARDSDPACCTMERTSDGNWVSNNCIIRNGLDCDGNPLNGTPGQANSADVLAQWAPAVALTSLLEAGGILSGSVMVTWEASDPNGPDSALSIDILISDDEGETWSVLIENLANVGSFSWDVSAQASGTGYKLLLRASDAEGYLGEAASASFEIVGVDT